MDDRKKLITMLIVGAVLILGVGFFSYHHSNGRTTYVGKPSSQDLSNSTDLGVMGSNFLSGCETEATQSQCECMWNGIMESESKEQIFSDSTNYINTGYLPTAWVDIANNCQ